jgi:chromosome segregation ATPase
VGDKSSKQSETEEDSFVEKEAGEKTAVDSADVEKSTAQATSSLQDDDNEKRILKNEVVSLNEEIKSHNKRLRAIQDEYQRSKKKIEHYQSQISDSDKIIRELRAREEDMSESMRNKDSQLAILRVRFDEIDNELRAKRTELERISKESERFVFFQPTRLYKYSKNISVVT